MGSAVDRVTVFFEFADVRASVAVLCAFDAAVCAFVAVACAASAADFAASAADFAVAAAEAASVAALSVTADQVVPDTHRFGVFAPPVVSIHRVWALRSAAPGAVDWTSTLPLPFAMPAADAAADAAASAAPCAVAALESASAASWNASSAFCWAAVMSPDIVSCASLSSARRASAALTHAPPVKTWRAFFPSVEVSNHRSPSLESAAAGWVGV